MRSETTSKYFASSPDAGLPESTDVTVIGAGIGGIAAACLLATDGWRVTVLERNEKPGGKIQQFEWNGYRFDAGPTLLTLPEILGHLYSRCGSNIRRHLDLVRMDPVCRYHYPDGTQFLHHADPDRTIEEVQRIAPEDLAAFKKFLNYSARLYRTAAPPFLYNPLAEWGDLRQVKLFDLFRIDPMTTISRRIDKSFRSVYLRNFFKRFTTYSGSSPWLAPATLNIIPHIEIEKGGWYVKGGIYRIAESLTELAESLGVTFHFQTEVKSIEVDKKGPGSCQTTGVKLGNGQLIRSSVVISNCDPTETMNHLLPEESKTFFRNSRIRRQSALEPSCSGYVLLLAAQKQWPLLRHHNIYFSNDYRDEFEQIFSEKKLPEDPTIYVVNSSVTDPADAPEGGSNLFILVNAPSLGEHPEHQQSENDYPDRIIEKLESSGLNGLSESIAWRKILTPRDFQDQFRAWRGSIYGTSSNSRFSAFFRPGNRVKGIDGLYLTGGGTHPGGGIPLVIRSAVHTAELVERFENRDANL